MTPLVFSEVEMAGEWMDLEPQGQFSDESLQPLYAFGCTNQVIMNLCGLMPCVVFNK
jgi:hypothetical protein